MVSGTGVRAAELRERRRFPLPSPALGELPRHLTTGPEEALHVGKTSLAGPGQGAAVGTQVRANKPMTMESFEAVH